MDNEVQYCSGCGVKIQIENKAEVGYAPPSALKNEILICQRCFRLKHYNEIQDVSLTDDDFLKILNNIGYSTSLVVKIVDIFDFNGSWLPGLHRFIGKNKIILVGNKVDLLPKSVKRSKLIQWMKYSAKQLGLKPEEVYLISASKGEGVKELAEQIDMYREGKDVYVVGATNVGKSSFINRIIKEFSGEDNVITTSQFPGTTLDLIGVPLDDGATLYDTPGIINHHQMAHFVDEKGLKIISPKKEIKPRIFQLNEGQTLFFGGLARFDYIAGGRKSFTCYVSNELNIHRTKIEKAEQLYKEHLGELLQPPFGEKAQELPPLQKQEFTIKEAKTDIVFHGLGWITCNEPGSKVIAYAPNGVGVTIRQSLI
ncbi:ribosome biogenesis GTPase YqeH [Calidifontibacillus oryziterrae]|uniref:ribosome biogenesis GTPase YqeH n=1 Tax=Calidifontibacillus oryziterrae TaxID=1191699 RepID=UPI00031C4CC0|nr:ribosome biogenesis GTPase YqeH [Calidifontibacillus oryziterrae]